jgi:hypothetical protein
MRGGTMRSEIPDDSGAASSSIPLLVLSFPFDSNRNHAEIDTV